MKPENIVPAENGNKKKFLIIALVVILAVVGAALGYLFMQKDTPEPIVTEPVVVDSPIVTPPRIYTDAEKRQILEVFEKQNSTSTLSDAEKLRILKNFSLKNQTPILSDAEKRKALEEFESSTQSTQ